MRIPKQLLKLCFIKWSMILQYALSSISIDICFLIKFNFEKNLKLKLNPKKMWSIDFRF